jgi:hypothetical protein
VLLNSIVKQATITRQLCQRSYTPPPNLRVEFHIPDMSTNRSVLCLMLSCAAVPILRIIHILLCFPSIVRDCKPALTVHLERSRVLFVQPECPKKVCTFLLLYFLFIFSTIQQNGLSYITLLRTLPYAVNIRNLVSSSCHDEDFFFTHPFTGKVPIPYQVRTRVQLNAIWQNNYIRSVKQVQQDHEIRAE